MRHLRHHAADGVVVRTLDHLVQPGKSQPLDHQFLFHRSTNGGPYPLQLNLSAARIRFLRRHFMNLNSLVEGYDYSSCAVLPRIAATPSRVLSCFSASKVALITLCGFVVPIDFVSTFCTPTEVITARTAPPAIRSEEHTSELQSLRH